MGQRQRRLLRPSPCHRPCLSGIGTEILTFAETYARNAGKEVLRLDSQKVNDDLSRYYEALGYPAVGECIDGAYVGIKRENL